MAEKYFFISYRSVEQDFALKLARDLLQVGYPVWMDRLHGVLPGDDWRQSLEQGVNNAAALLACVSRNYVESMWCRRELQRADSLKKPIFPILIGPMSDDIWPMEIQDKQYADFQNWTEATAYQVAFTSLLEGVRKRFGVQPGKPIEPPQPGEPDPSRDDPEDRAERGIAKLTLLEKVSEFAAIEAEERRKDMALWVEMYKAAAQAYRITTDDATRVRLKLQMETFKSEWEKLDGQR